MNVKEILDVLSPVMKEVALALLAIQGAESIIADVWDQATDEILILMKGI